MCAPLPLDAGCRSAGQMHTSGEPATGQMPAMAGVFSLLVCCEVMDSQELEGRSFAVGLLSELLLLGDRMP